MKLIVGLGNPIDEGYERTRHNVGVRVVRLLGKIFAEHLDSFADWKNDKTFNAMWTKGKIDGNDVALLYPLTYMNESGGPVQKAAHFWNVEPADVVVVYDDKEIPLGGIRIRKDGSAGGHNGMGSVLEMLGTQDVPRVRVGIGTEASSERKVDAADYVLGKFTKDEEARLALDKAVQALETIVREGIDAAMNKYNN